MSKQNKTQATFESVDAYIAKIKNEQKRADSKELLTLIHKVSGYEAKMWGTSMVGFGEYHYRYDSGREGDFMRVGFAARSQNLSIYIIPGFSELEHLLEKLGPHKTGKSCLYIKRLADIDTAVLTEIIAKSLNIMAQKYPDKA